jgi:O-antigen/teichoic acid export membrane protein
VRDLVRRPSLNANLDDTNLKERAIRGGLFTSVSQVVEAVLRIVAIAILARLLVPEYFGLLSMVTAITTIAERFKDLGLSTATVQKPNITHEQVSTLFWINVVTGVGIAILIASLSWTIAGFFREPRLVAITIAVATSFVWSGLTMQHQALLQRQMRYMAIGSIQLGSTVVSTVFAIALALQGYGYWALVARELTRNVATAVGTWGCCRWMPGRPRAGVDVAHLMRFGGHLTSFNVIVFLTASVDQILLGKVYGAAQLGLYRQSYQLIFGPVAQLTGPLSRVAEPTLSYMQADHPRYRTGFHKMVSTVNLIMMPVALFLAVYAKEVVVAVLGPQWREAVVIFRILAVAAVIGPASDMTGLLLVTCGKTRRYLALGVVTGVILLCSFGIGVLGGARGMAWGYLVATYILLAVRVRYSFEDTPVRVGDFVNTLSRPLAAAVVMSGAVLLLHTLVDVNTGLKMLAMAAVGGVIYVVALMIIPGGKAQLHEIVRDVLVGLRLDRYRDVITGRNRGTTAI